MFKPEKTAAFLLGLLIFAGSAVSAMPAVFADEEAETEASEAETETESDAEEENEYITSGDYEYSLTSDNSICIESYIGNDTDIIIPDTIDGIEVTELGGLAFFETNAVSVHIPEGITYIDNNPFMESYSLEEITVDEDNQYYYAEDGVLYLNRSGSTVLLCYPQGKEDSAFAVPDDVSEIGAAAIYATRLKELTLSPNLTYIYHHGISYNESLTALDMSVCTSLTEIGEMAMTSCTSLEDVAFPESLTSIGSGAFAQCTSLTEIELPENLITIGQNAFAATGLKKVQIPESVTDIGYCAFGYDENLEALEDFIIIGETGSAAETYASDTDEEYDYANNFTFIDSANADLIGESATLETVTGDEYVYAIKDGEIYILSCLLTNPTIEIPSEIDGMPVTCLYGASFYQNQATKIVIPDTVTKIGSITFADCYSLESIDLPDSLTEIDSQAFAGCSSLKSLEIPASCEIIGEEAFYGCTGITEYKVKSGSDYFTSEDGVLYNKDKTIIIAYPPAKTDKYYKAPDSAAEILASAFAGNGTLENVDISTVITIGDYAFESCSALNEVKLSEDLEVIGTCAFYNCQSLLAMRTYNKITEIGTVAIGYYYDESDTENNGDVLVEGFILYADDNSGGSRYAYINGIECESDVSKYTESKAPAATVEIFGVKVEKAFLYVVCAALAVIIVASAAVLINKRIKKNKVKKEAEELKSTVEKKLAEKYENSGGKDKQ